MGKIEKLIAKLKARSSAISFEEAEVLLEHFGYQRSDKGRTSGSRVMFVRKESDLKILLHKPHPRRSFRSIKESNCSSTWNRRDFFEQHHAIQGICGKC